MYRQRRVTADTALRLARYFKMSAHFWLGLQMDDDLDLAKDNLTSAWIGKSWRSRRRHILRREEVEARLLLDRFDHLAEFASEQGIMDIPASVPQPVSAAVDQLV